MSNKDVGIDGLTLYIVIGRYAGFRLVVDVPAVRLVFGWVSFGIILRDLEVMMHRVSVLLDATNALAASVNRTAEGNDRE